MSTASEYRRKSIYNHENSKKARAKPGEPGPVARLQSQHRDEKLKLGAKHRDESIKFENEATFKRSHAISRGKAPEDPFSKAPDAEHNARNAMNARQSSERTKLTAQHRDAMDHAMKQNPLD
jgi:hypothetical protein